MRFLKNCEVFGLDFYKLEELIKWGSYKLIKYRTILVSFLGFFLFLQTCSRDITLLAGTAAAMIITLFPSPDQIVGHFFSVYDIISQGNFFFGVY